LFEVRLEAGARLAAGRLIPPPASPAGNSRNASGAENAPPRARPYANLPSGKAWRRWHDLRATTRQHTYLIVPIASGDDFNPLLLVRFLFAARLSGKLQYGRPLTRNEACQQHDAAIREFQRIMMHVLLVFVDLPEASHA
jgi:hypothetical protein